LTKNLLTPEELKNILRNNSLPQVGVSSGKTNSKATNILMNESLLNSHPKFMGYITGISSIVVTN
tara:strand:- start:3022 stop:3216 length:195 start_codon:yes stop_codon:yes gene_type:complete